jgi:hypothetical protein
MNDNAQRRDPARPQAGPRLRGRTWDEASAPFAVGCQAYSGPGAGGA